MKVLFLDMDGVLCTTRSHLAYSTRFFMQHLDPVACKLVERLCKESGAKIVLSSTWRTMYDQRAMTAILLQAGFAEVPWHQCWKTPEFKGLSRGEEIARWHETNQGVEGYVILDDDQDFLAEQVPYLVVTDTHDGLRYEDFEKARRILTAIPSPAL